MSAVLDEAAVYADALAEEQRLEAELPPPPCPSPADWAALHRRIDGRPFTLDRFRPLRALYEDEYPHIVVMKPAQRGVSEWAINRICYALEHGARAWGPRDADGRPAKDGLNVGYIFPTEKALGDFSKERLSGLKDESPHLRALFSGKGAFDAVTFKQVGRSYLYLRGAESKVGLLTFPADMILLDEYDGIGEGRAALAHRRMNASEIKRRADISTPTLPGRGIHAAYLLSDRRVYEQPCPACGLWRRWDFFADVRADGEPYGAWRRWPAERVHRADIRLTCPRCGHELTRGARCAPGRWVAQEPDVAGLRGYHIPWGAFPFVSLVELAVKAVSDNPGEIQEFYRSDLGLPYEAGGTRVTGALLDQLSHALPGRALPDLAWRNTTMGVDVGARFHYRVSGEGDDGGRYVLEMGSVGSWGELDAVLERRGVRQCVVDAMPELHGAREWAARHRGKVLRALYPGAAALPGQHFRVDEARRTVQINRTMAMDAVFAAIAGGREHWPAAIHDDPEVRAHLTAPIRVTVTGADGQERASWEHTAPDHFFHACVYDDVARAALPPAHRQTRGGTIVGGVSGWQRSR